MQRIPLLLRSRLAVATTGYGKLQFQLQWSLRSTANRSPYFIPATEPFPTRFLSHPVPENSGRKGQGLLPSAIATTIFSGYACNSGDCRTKEIRRRIWWTILLLQRLWWSSPLNGYAAKEPDINRMQKKIIHTINHIYLEKKKISSHLTALILTLRSNPKFYPETNLNINFYLIPIKPIN